MDNRMTLDEVESWVASGKSLTDAAAGLLFTALSLTHRTHGEDKAIPVYMELAHNLLLLSIAETLDTIRRREVP